MHVQFGSTICLADDDAKACSLKPNERQHDRKRDTALVSVDIARLRVSHSVLACSAPRKLT
jgi:hypothetical protein